MCLVASRCVRLHRVVATLALTGAAAYAADVPVMVPAPAHVATNAVHSPASTNAPVPPLVDIKSLPSNTVFTVQLGAFTTRDRAFTVFWDLSRKVPSLQLIPPFGKDKLYRVSHGSFATYNEARAAADKLHKENIDCFVTPVGRPELAVNGPRGD